MSGRLKNTVEHIKDQLNNKFLFGSEEILELMAIAFFAKGHVLIEGPPGTAKTLCAKLMAQVVSKSFNRIQFTSDMLPGDILGAHIYSPTSSSFDFIKGPLFADFILADEINRTPPRTQSALLEAMEEKQVTSEGKQFKLSPDFFVVATQNPHDFEGTFPLPEAQLDRFLFKITTDHASPEVEIEVLDKITKGVLPPQLNSISTIKLEWEEIDREIDAITIDRSIFSYITSILSATRNHNLLSDGSSIRGGIALIKCSRIMAILKGRDYVIPDDIKALALPTLRHRVRLSADAVISDAKEAGVIGEILKSVPFPK